MRKKLGLVLLFGVVALAWSGSTGEAAPITMDFCPDDATCPAGVIEASITFDDMFGGDTDYSVLLTIAVDDTAGYFVNDVQFDDGVAASDYATTNPDSLLMSVPSGSWTTHFDNISGSGNSCNSDNSNKQSVCSTASPELGAWISDGSASWLYEITVDSASDVPTSSSNWNLRAEFRNRDGSMAGILSPDGNSTSVPEPSALVLLTLGLGLLALGRRRP